MDFQQGKDARALVLVFGSNVAGLHREANAAFAVRHFGAEEGRWNGLNGASYAIPYRSSKLELLPVDVIKRYVDLFVEYTKAQTQTNFRVTRFACGTGQHSDESMAGLFRLAPSNCALNAIWQRQLEPWRGPRIILSDPTDGMRSQEAQRKMRHLLEDKLAATENGEIVSIDGLSNLRMDEALARVLAFEHRIVRPDLARYGAHAGMAAEVEAVWASTHLISIASSVRRTQPMQIRLVALGSREGLHVSDLHL